MRHHRAGGSRRLRLSGMAGYTAIELAIALALMGIVLALAIPAFRPVMEHTRVRAAASVLAIDLQYAQMLAARQRRPVVVTLDQDKKEYVISDRSDGGAVFRTRQFGQDSDYRLDEFLSTGSKIEVFPTGITHENTTFTLGLGGYQRHVTFTRAGQIRLLPGS